MTEEQAEDQAGDEGAQAGGATAAGRSPEPKERLDALQQDIDEVRRRVEDDELDEELGQGDHSLLDEGERSLMTEDGSEGPGDDTIAPPG